MSVFVSKAWPSCVYSVSLVVRGSLLHLYPIILYFLLTLRLEHSQYNRCLAGYQTERVLSLVGFFFLFTCELVKSSCFASLGLGSCGVRFKHSVCCLVCLACSPSMHCSHVNLQKHQLQRESCFFFMQACFLSSWIPMYVTYVLPLSPCFLFWIH